jgi:hypothetical protein
MTFPPIATYPLSREARYVTRLNRTADFTEYRAPDAATPRFAWDVDIGPVTDAEAAQVLSFYQTRGGGYESFAFLDPMDNLLLWSEDFSQAAWVKSLPANLSITPGVSDPFGENAAQTLANTAGTPNVVSQEVAADPSGITFTASVWLKSATAPVTLRLAGGPSTTVTPAATWTRFMARGAANPLRFELEIPGGASVDVFGAQLVALPGPGNYVRTTTESGCHPACRFEGGIEHRALGPDHNTLKLRIYAHD